MNNHWRIATIASNTVDEAAKAINRETENIDFFEVRLDFIWPTVPDEEQATNDLLTLLDAATAPLLATLRPQRQGGKFDGPEEVRLSLLAAAAKCGFAAVDVEADNRELGQLVRQMHGACPNVIASLHLAGKAPTKDEGLMALQAMQDSQANRQKLAFPQGAFPDFLRALELCHTFGQVHGSPVIAPVGANAMQRALLPLAGSRATYGRAHDSGPAVSGQPKFQDIAACWQHWGLDQRDLSASAGTWLAVIGRPVDHSISPAIHNKWLQEIGRPERYGALEVPESLGALRLLFSVASRIGLKGVGVTAPFKVDALSICEPDDIAKAVGAVNTVRFENGNAHGTNTDYLGLTKLLQNATGQVAVLGAGGVARAAMLAAKKLGLDVVFCSRDESSATKISKELDVAWIPWHGRDSIHAPTWIQCTSIGSTPGDKSPLPDNKQLELAIEMVYAAGKTAFEEQASDARATVIGGLEVLQNQAALQYEFWTGEMPNSLATRVAA